MLALRPVLLAVIAAVPTPVVLPAVLLPAPVPVTTETVSPFTKPVMVSLKVGLASPYSLLWLLAVTVRVALLMTALRPVCCTRL